MEEEADAFPCVSVGGEEPRRRDPRRRALTSQTFFGPPTSRGHRADLALALPLEDIRAHIHRAMTGSIGNTKVVTDMRPGSEVRNAKAAGSSQPPRNLEGIVARQADGTCCPSASCSGPARSLSFLHTD